MRIPVVNRTSEVSAVRRGRGCPAHTVKNGSDEYSGKVGLLLQVQRVWDLGSVGIIGPELFLRVGHRFGVFRGRDDTGGVQDRTREARRESEVKGKPRREFKSSGNPVGQRWMPGELKLTTYHLEGVDLRPRLITKAANDSERLRSSP